MKTIAVDFLGDFARERSFFEHLAPTVICETDLRLKGYDRPDWMFMAAASLLFADYLDLGGIGFGTILEASASNLRPNIEVLPLTTPEPFAALDIYDATITRGITEFGTAMVLLKYAPDLISGSLASLAAPGSEKSFRKRLLVDAIKHAQGGPPPAFDSYKYPTRKAKWGGAITVDFLAIYFIRTYGREVVERWMEKLDGIDWSRIATLNVGWYLKFNTKFVRDIPMRFRATVLSRCLEADIAPYDEVDWQGFAAVCELLAETYSIPGATTLR